MNFVNQSEEKIHCPRCDSTQVVADKKGFSGVKACCGALAVGPLGILCGTHKQNKINLICLKCKKTF